MVQSLGLEQNVSLDFYVSMGFMASLKIGYLRVVTIVISHFLFYPFFCDKNHR
jgi:hypothetical protein